VRRLSEAVMNARGVLLEQYGHPHTWVRFDTPVRIVDARPRRNTPNYLGWARVDAEPGPSGRVPVRWINETNFNRYYRKVQE
jgi:hypothetical protein